MLTVDLCPWEKGYGGGHRAAPMAALPARSQQHSNLRPFYSSTVTPHNSVLVCSDTAHHVLFSLFLCLGMWLRCVTSPQTSTTALVEWFAGGKGGSGHALRAAWLQSDSRQQRGVQQQRKMSDKGCATCCCVSNI